MSVFEDVTKRKALKIARGMAKFTAFIRWEKHRIRWQQIIDELQQELYGVGRKQ